MSGHGDGEVWALDTSKSGTVRAWDQVMTGGFAHLVSSVACVLPTLLRFASLRACGGDNDGWVGGGCLILFTHLSFAAFIPCSLTVASSSSSSSAATAAAAAAAVAVTAVGFSLIT